MARSRSVCFVLLSLMVICFYLLALRQANHVQSQEQRPFGRYTEHDVIQMAMPIIQAILPGRDDLYLAAEHGQVMGADNQPQRIWSVDCTDNEGNGLIHIGRDADNGRIYWISYSPTTMPAASRAVALSSQQAVVEAQRWLRTLGYNETWAQGGGLEHRTPSASLVNAYWHVSLESPGWCAHVSLDASTGVLFYADLMPTH